MEGQHGSQLVSSCPSLYTDGHYLHIDLAGLGPKDLVKAKCARVELCAGLDLRVE